MSSEPSGYFLILPFASVFILVLGAYKYIDYKSSNISSYYVSPSSTPTPIITKSLTLDEVKKFNGKDPSLPIYMVYEGLVYDVSSGSKFYAKGKPYNILTARDATKEINLVGLGSTIKEKYPVVAKIVN